MISDTKLQWREFYLCLQISNHSHQIKSQLTVADTKSYSQEYFFLITDTKITARECLFIYNDKITVRETFTDNYRH